MATQTTVLPATLLETDEYRVDADEKVSGSAKYAADFSREGMLWAAFLTSPHPHAEVLSVDTAAARTLPGVRAVLSGADIGERHLGRILFDWPVLAFEKVRFAGDYVAAVAAETPELARAAVERIDVRYRVLPPLLDPEEALAADAPLVHAHPERYTYNHQGRDRDPVPHKNLQGYDRTVHGDVEAGFAAATRIFEHTFTTPRYFAGYVEPRATLVWIEDGGTLHVVTTNKAPFGLRRQLSITTGLPQETIVVEPAYIGGDFGAKGFSLEEFHCYFLARATGRPVKHVRGYADDMRATAVRHAAKITLRSGVDADGRFTAFEARVLANGGAYAAGKPLPALIPGAKVKTPYRIPHARVERLCVYTNTVPSGQVRDPAGIPLNFAIESHVDAIARELGADPLAFREHNAIRGDELDVDGTAYVEPKAIEVLAELRKLVAWGTPLPAGRGRGVSLTSRHVGGGKTSLTLALGADGIVDARSGAVEQGTGTMTVIARVVAGVLDVGTDRVRVRRGATGTVPPDPGVGGSRATHIVGRAAHDAATQLRRALEGAGYPAVGWDEAVAALLRAGPVQVTGSYDDGHHHGDPESHNFCAYCVEVTVDRETGEVSLDDVVFVADVGAIVNPLAHRGQINGGFAFGLGHGLTEELRLEDGRIVNLNLGEYKVPTQRDMPPFRVRYLGPNPGPGPFGAKSVGELTTSGVAPAIANAVADACGARLTTLPLTAERIFAALR